ncbi:MAG: D-aminoacyl-tRNA deacylase [Christensenellales bacterium]|jgi:D-tyrosyl-tRNA(Tyr) deacylase
MRAVIQRVSRAAVRSEGVVSGQIGPGFVVLLGVEREDGVTDAKYIAEKIAHLRVFEDGERKMNLSLLETGGSVLLVSQFTLLGDARKGRRPSFIAAERPERADELYQVVKQGLESLGIAVETGVFRTHMEVELVNDGPVTILLDSRRVF